MKLHQTTEIFYKVSLLYISKYLLFSEYLKYVFSCVYFFQYDLAILLMLILISRLILFCLKNSFEINKLFYITILKLFHFLAKYDVKT